MPIPAGPDPTAPTVPDWAPPVDQVAVYVPHRTLVRAEDSSVESDDSYLLTFGPTTLPTDTQVDQLIADGAAWVAAQVSPMNSVSESAAAVCAALYAAAAVERGWPTDDQSLQRANDIEKRLDTLLAALVKSNDAANGADDIDDDAGDYGLDIAYPYDPNSVYL